MKNNIDTTHKMADFFAGSGLVSSGFNGICKSVWANDINEIKAKIFKANHGDNIILSDIKKISSDAVPTVDLIWGSFPCQDLSLAGNFSGINGERSGLVWEWFRILRGKSNRPKVVIAENVCGLLSSNDGNDYLSLHNAMVDLGYRVGCVVLDALHWLPHSRPRVFVIGIKAELVNTGMTLKSPSWCHPSSVAELAKRIDGFVFWKLPIPKKRTVNLSDIIDRNFPFTDSFSNSALALIGDEHRARLIEELNVSPEKVFAGYRRTRKGKQKLELRFDDVAGCLRTAKGGSSKQIIVYKYKGKIIARFISSREAARLMGVPDTYVFPVGDNDVYTAMGDAVAIPVVKFLANSLIKKAFNNAK